MTDESIGSWCARLGLAATPDSLEAVRQAIVAAGRTDAGPDVMRLLVRAALMAPGGARLLLERVRTGGRNNDLEALAKGVARKASPVAAPDRVFDSVVRAAARGRTCLPC